MIIKVCGIRSQQNITDIAGLKIDMIGLNFYPPSVRYIDDGVQPESFDELPDTMSRVGVFVNESLDDILDKVDEYRLDYVQLHGDEDFYFAEKVALHVGLIKVVRVGPTFAMKSVQAYAFASYILFDTESNAYGGSGHKFDWSVLGDYALEVPFLLGGGIGPADVDELLTVDHKHYTGIDINSKFESSPGIKDSETVQSFVTEIRRRVAG